MPAEAADLRPAGDSKLALHQINSQRTTRRAPPLARRDRPPRGAPHQSADGWPGVLCCGGCAVQEEGKWRWCGPCASQVGEGRAVNLILAGRAEKAEAEAAADAASMAAAAAYTAEPVQARAEPAAKRRRGR